MRIGTDIIEIDRIRQAYHRNPRIARKILSSQEYETFQLKMPGQQLTFLTGRFCAKEAYSKALGTGFRGPLKMSDIWIDNDSLGRPKLLQGPVIDGVDLSISHSKTVAMATCIIDMEEARLQSLLKEKGIYQ